jgi:heme exporter protein CcmD
MDKFFFMDGYGGYIWPAYGISAIALGILTWLVMRRWRASDRQLKEIQQRQKPANQDE